MTRVHALQLALASYATRYPFTPPPYWSHAEELDWLNSKDDLVGNAHARREWLRSQRAAGAIAGPGERWEDELMRAGYLPARTGTFA